MAGRGWLWIKKMWSLKRKITVAFDFILFILGQKTYAYVINILGNSIATVLTVLCSIVVLFLSARLNLIRAVCKSKEPVCGDCMGSHDTKDCRQTRAKCANCKITAHKPWFTAFFSPRTDETLAPDRPSSLSVNDQRHFMLLSGESSSSSGSRMNW